jgi:hypothetical protein
MHIEQIFNALIDKREFDKAKNLIELARSVNPTNASLKKNLAVVLIYLGDIESATALLSNISGGAEPDSEGDSFNARLEVIDGRQTDEDSMFQPEDEQLDYRDDDHTPGHPQRTASDLIHKLIDNDSVEDLEEAFDEYWVPDVERRTTKKPLTTITADLFGSPQATNTNDRQEEVLGKATLWATRLSIEFGLNPTDRENLEKAIEAVPNPNFLASLGGLLGNSYRAPEIYLAACFIAYWRENYHLSENSLDTEFQFFMPATEEILDFVRSYRFIPQPEEMLRFVELAHGEWSTNVRIRRRYPSFFDCLQECARQADTGPVSPDALN